jgi:cytochrome b561
MSQPMSAPHPFPVTSRLLHWSMAVLILLMLFIGVGMVTAPDSYHRLVSIHRPLGVAILVLAAIRLVNRQVRRPPALPPAMPGLLKLAARGSHVALYALMFAVPLVGWAMLSAGGYPVVLFGGVVLPPIVPHAAPLYAALRGAHTVLALLLFATFLLHLGAALAHAVVFRDGVFQSMAGGGEGRGYSRASRALKA